MNPIVIEQSPDETRMAFEVHRNSSIVRVRVSRAKVSARSIDDRPDARIGVGFGFKSKELPGPDRILRLEILFRVKGTEIAEDGDNSGQTTGDLAPAREPEQVLAIECAFEVDYALQGDFQPSPDQVKAFREGNAVFNVWPFFREYVHNQMQRMGLPPLTAPFLRIEPRSRHAARRVRRTDPGGTQQA